MRIITGIYKGRIIKVPKGKSVRPTTDKNREAIFNYLANILDFDGISACDIYAGSGSLGLETLSRGAANVDFVEKNYQCYMTLKSNIESLDETGSCRVFKISALQFSQIEKPGLYDLILADPPFFKFDIYPVVKNLVERDYLKENGVLLVERSVQTKNEDVENFGIEPFKRLGDSLLYQFNA